MPKKKTEIKKETEKAPKKKAKKAEEKAVEKNLEKAKEPKVELQKKIVRPIEPEKAAPVKTSAPHIEIKPKEKKAKEPKEAKAVYYASGGRKTSRSRVWISAGNGKIDVNGRPLDQYVAYRDVLVEAVTRPFKITNTFGRYDVLATISGGGIASQAEALRHGISKALTELNPDFRGVLKRDGLLTRDPRIKERKKYGRKRARRRFQYSKR